MYIVHVSIRMTKILNVEYVQTENSDCEYWFKEKTKNSGVFLSIYAYTQYLVSNSHECTTPSFLKLNNVIQ